MYPQYITDFVNNKLQNIPLKVITRHIKCTHPDEYNDIIKMTSFLDSSKFTERLYYIKHDINSIVYCKYCGYKPVKFKNITLGHHTFCSNRCNKNDEESKNRTEKTNIERYGVKNPFQSEMIKDKIKQTNIKRYGTEFASQSDIFHKHRRESYINIYGVDHPMKRSEIRDKIKLTCIQRYGVDHPWKSDEIRKTCVNTMIDRYGVNNPMKCDEIKMRVFQNRETLLRGDKILETFKIVPNIGKHENRILNEIEDDECITIIRQYPVCGYFVDGYCEETNTVYEVDEKYHESRKDEDDKRQKIITKYLNCKFIRIKDY